MFVAALAAVLLAVSGPSPAADSAAATDTDPAACQTVRLSDIGWTDVTATTAVFSELLRRLGYRPEITVLSVPVTYASLKNQ